MNIFSSKKEKKKTFRIRLKSPSTIPSLLPSPEDTTARWVLSRLCPYTSHKHKHTREITHIFFVSMCWFLLRWYYLAYIALYLSVNNVSWKLILVVTYISSSQTSMKTLPFLPLIDLYVVSNILLIHFLPNISAYSSLGTLFLREPSGRQCRITGFCLSQ